MKCQAIKRISHNTSVDVSKAAIKITPYYTTLKEKLKSLSNLAVPTRVIIPESKLALVPQTTWFFTSKQNPRPFWSGYMQHLNQLHYL